MAIKDFITLKFLAKNEVSETADEIGESLQDLKRQKTEADNELKKITAQSKLIEKFKTLEKTLEASEQAAKDTALNVEKLALEMSAAGVPTQKMAAELKAAQLNAKAADRAFISNKNNLARMSAQVVAANGDIKQLTTAEARLKAEAARAAREAGVLAAKIRETGQASNTAGQGTENLTGKWSDLWAKTTLVTGAIAGAVIGLKEFLNSAGNAEYANKKLADTLTRTTGATNEQIKATQAQAEALQKTTRFNDEEIKAAQEKLAQYQLTAGQVQQLTPLLLDMAEAKRESGDADADTIGSAEAIGDALRDNITALESFGVHITDATEEQHKAADEAERMAIIVDRLSTSFGGAAEAAGQTFAGAMDKTANKVKQSLEEWANLITQNEAIKQVLTDVGALFESIGPKAEGGASSATIAITGLGVALGSVLDAFVVGANIIQNAWNAVQIAVLSVEQVAVNAWANLMAAMGNDDAAAGAEALAKTIDEQLIESFKAIEKNNGEMATQYEKLKKRFTDYDESIKKTTENLETTATATKALTTATKDNAATTEQSASVLKDHLAGLGLSYDKLATGIDSGTGKVIDNFAAIVAEVSKTTTKSQELAKVLGPALAATLEKIDTPEGFIALQKKIDETAKSTDGLAGAILGSLAPAMAAHELKLESTGQYVDYVKERYDKLAKVLGVDLPGATDTASAALDKNTEKLDSNADAANDAAKSTIESASQVAEVVSAKGAGLAAFFNAASSQMYGLSEAAGQAFEQNLGRSVVSGVEFYTQKSEQSLSDLARSMQNVTTNGVAKWLKGVATSSHRVQAEFYAQRAEVEKLTLALESTENPSDAMVRNAARAVDKFNLLDDATLSGLKSQIDAARTAIKALEDDAASTLKSIENDLANAKGEYSIAVKNEFDDRLENLESQLKEATATGNTSAKSDLTESIKQLKELRAIEVAAAIAREQAEKTPAPQSSASTSSDVPTVIKIGSESIAATVAPDELARLSELSTLNA